MFGFGLRRAAVALPLLFGVATLVFLLIHLIPGDPVAVMLGTGASAADVEDLRHRLGLDRPLGGQYLAFLAGIVRGDLGLSLHYRDPVAALILERGPATLLLAAASMGAAILLALPAGIAAALRPGGLADRATTTLSALALSFPSFGLGPVLLLVFAVRLDWLPVSGLDEPAAVILPALTLGLPVAALLARLVRAALVEEQGLPYVRAARARGLGAVAAGLGHALPNALPPVVTVAALQAGSLLTGAILTETIFAWPGLGRLLVQAINHRDYPLVQGCVLVICGVYIGVNLAADLLHRGLDPRAAA
jgi:peptide/nickel transport system permease protein